MAFMLRTPASCSLKPIRSLSAWPFTSAISPHSFRGLGGLGHLALQLGDASVAVCDLLLPAGTGVVGHFSLGLCAFLLLLLLRLALRTLRGFLAAILLTVHDYRLSLSRAANMKAARQPAMRLVGCHNFVVMSSVECYARALSSVFASLRTRGAIFASNFMRRFSCLSSCLKISASLISSLTLQSEVAYGTW